MKTFQRIARRTMAYLDGAFLGYATIHDPGEPTAWKGTTRRARQAERDARFVANFAPSATKPGGNRLERRAAAAS